MRMNFIRKVVFCSQILSTNYTVSKCRLVEKLYSTSGSVSNNTIFSLSSGLGKSGVAVIRVSGPQTKEVINLMTSHGESTNFNVKPVKPRMATLRKLRHPTTHDLIDEGLVLWFPGPKSFTGEDCCEFQVHGGVAVISAICEAINSVDGLRPSLPGEFTKRAFWAGKLDLSEVEGLADLIHAETDIQRKQALLQTQGIISQLYNDWRKRLLKIIAYVEAYIDFAEDQNIEDDTLEKVRTETRQLIEDIENYLKDSHKGEMRRFGIKTAILGEPNVGKSSFMNHICRKSISIVANIPGTTRDIIESSFNIAGYPVVMADTAGLRCLTDDVVEKEGIARAINYATTADIVLLVMDAAKLQCHNFNVNEYKQQYFKSLGLDAHSEIIKKPCLNVVNKIDLVEFEENKYRKESAVNDDTAYISCKNEIGLAETLAKFENMIKHQCGDPFKENPTLSNERHSHLLKKCLEKCRQFECDFALVNSGGDEDIDYAMIAQQLRDSLQCIGYITGTIRTDEVLDVIFRDFCIGK